jgi:hypothetical protein
MMIGFLRQVDNLPYAVLVKYHQWDVSRIADRTSRLMNEPITILIIRYFEEIVTLLIDTDIDNKQNMCRSQTDPSCPGNVIFSSGLGYAI